MSHFNHRQFNNALARIENAILPNLALLLDQVLEAASLARAGVDAEEHAAGLRKTAHDLTQLTELVAIITQPPKTSA